MLQRLKTDLIGKIRAIDPKLIAAGVAYIGARLVVELAGLPLDGRIVDLGSLGVVTWEGAIAYAAAAVAGWWKANAGSILRTPQESGNPAPEAMEGRFVGPQV